MMLTDARWAVLEPLVEQCRPCAKMLSPSKLRRTTSAILWRRANGAKWHSLPADSDPSGAAKRLPPGGTDDRRFRSWWMAAPTFIRWSRLGVWERLLALAQERGVQLGMTFLDGTNIRAHHKAAGAARQRTLQHSAALVKRLAVLVAAMGAKPA